MNNEIKEIVNGKVGFVFNHKDRDEILDLITDLQEVEINKYQTLKDLQQENERLNKRIKELEEGFKATTEDLCEESTKIERLNNIINELERYLEDEKINLDDYLGCLDDEERHYEIVRLRPRYNDFKEIYDKLQELKGDSSNE